MMNTSNHHHIKTANDCPPICRWFFITSSFAYLMLIRIKSCRLAQQRHNLRLIVISGWKMNKKNLVNMFEYFGYFHYITMAFAGTVCQISQIEFQSTLILQLEMETCNSTWQINWNWKNWQSWLDKIEMKKRKKNICYLLWFCRNVHSATSIEYLQHIIADMETETPTLLLKNRKLFSMCLVRFVYQVETDHH